MKTFCLLLSLFLAAFGAIANPAPEVVSFDVRTTSMSGGPAEDVRKKAADFLSVPELARRESNVGSVLQRRFPRRMKKADLLSILRKIRIEHLCDTEMRDIPELVSDGVIVPSTLEFYVKNYSRVRTQASVAGSPAEEAVVEESFVFAFRFAKNGELIDASSYVSVTPL